MSREVQELCAVAAVLCALATAVGAGLAWAGWTQLVPVTAGAAVATTLAAGLAHRQVRDLHQALAHCEGQRQHAEEQLEEVRQARAMEKAELRSAVASAQAANEAKSAFLASMSHELRTPLNAIIGYAEILMEDLPDQEVQADLKRIRSSGKHLLALVNDVLDLSKVEAGQMLLSRSWFDVSELANEVAATVLPQVDERGNMLVLDLAQDIGRIHADRLRVQQIILNLLSNAAKFTDDGTVFLRAHRETREGREVVVFAIEDSGIGISDEQMDRIFRPFSQADPSIQHRYGGTGLGLVLCQRFAELMEGEILAESVVGEGSTFTLVLPVETTSARLDALHHERIEQAGAAGRPVVLCVDRDPISLDVLVRTVDGGGWFALPVLGLDGVVELVADVRPAAVVLGAHGEGGVWSLVPRLRDVARRLPIVVISTDGGRARAAALGATRHLDAPLDRGALRAVLQQYCAVPEVVG